MSLDDAESSSQVAELQARLDSLVSELKDLKAENARIKGDQAAPAQELAETEESAKEDAKFGSSLGLMTVGSFTMMPLA